MRFQIWINLAFAGRFTGNWPLLELVACMTLSQCDFSWSFRTILVQVRKHCSYALNAHCTIEEHPIADLGVQYCHP